MNARTLRAVAVDLKAPMARNITESEYKTVRRALSGLGFIVWVLFLFRKIIYNGILILKSLIISED